MKKLTVIILSLVLSFGVVGCSSNSKDDSTQEQQEQQKDTAATASEISTLLKDMYIVLKDSNGGTKDCKDKLVNYGKDINDAMLENKEYGSDMQKLKDATEDYDLEKIAKYVCDILNDIEGSDKYSIEIKSTDNTDKSNSNQNTKSNGNNQKSTNTNKNNNNNKNTNKNNEEEIETILARHEAKITTDLRNMLEEQRQKQEELIKEQESKKKGFFGFFKK